MVHNFLRYSFTNWGIWSLWNLRWFYRTCNGYWQCLFVAVISVHSRWYYSFSVGMSWFWLLLVLEFFLIQSVFLFNFTEMISIHFRFRLYFCDKIELMLSFYICLLIRKKCFKFYCPCNICLLTKMHFVNVWRHFFGEVTGNQKRRIKPLIQGLFCS